MAQIDLIKISELPATSTIGDADALAVVQGGATKKVPYSVLKAGAEVTPDTTLSEAGVPADAAAVGAALALKANKAAVTQALDAKADKTEVAVISGDIAELASVVETKADKTALNQKADKTTTDALRQDLTTLNGIVNQKADKTELNTQIGNVTAELATKANTADVNNLLAAKANVASPVFTGRPQAPTAPKGTATLQLATTAFVQNAIDDKQDTLTFDAAPTENSTNPVTSGGVYTAIEDAKDEAETAIGEVREESEEATAEAKEIALKAFATPTASGQLLTLTDGADGIPAKKLTLNLSPHQSGSGDPSPDNVRPISGYQSVTVTRAGKNVLPFMPISGTSSGVTIASDAEKQIYTVSGMSTGYRGFPAADTFTIKAGTYKLSRKASSDSVSDGDLRLELRSVDGTTIYIASDALTSVHTFEADTKVKPRIVVRLANINFETGIEYQFQLEVESTATAYEPYTAQEYNIALPTAAGTVYGGSLTVNDDGSGTLTVDMAAVDLGSVAWNKSSGNPDNIFFYGVCTGKQAGIQNIVSDRFVTISRTEWTAYSDAISGNANTSQIYIRTSQYADYTASEFKAAVSGILVVAELETSTTYTLTASQVTTLLGDNTVWMDADGSIDLVYRADTQKYIDSRIALFNANLAFIEDGMTASRAYSVGQYVLIGGQLCKVTASIASGATFTIGTNVTATTVGTELTALQ